MERAGTAALSAQQAQQAAAGTIALTGAFVRPMTVTLDDLRRHASATAEPFDLRCFTTNRFIRSVAPYRGARLKDLLDAAGLRNDTPGDFKRMVFIAHAHDGYAVTFSWHELFNTPVGEHVIVAFECGDAPLSIDDGAPLLFSGADLLPAPRHVKRLAGIVARVLEV
ncbi:molybdopterin-binding protein [Burkholderia cepacia]|uniref:molybdopterin-dependent oxidoreductase n=1 Tax=Burkholderia cepacia TaxID=292 RepID=UPI0007587478|nr:molybdopterin-dependent oxidoreductase [Burkholderia cepacia]KVQ41110.1 molybdopterin-binding protein [Burkholderia cepacia]KVS62046.1 molybdopterin-binding protein [Burkholderia cepacia]KVS75017.1 molybdopterin-binding protein [Burkholderia cepacia]QOH37579.1 oxidoreductase molybdopterin binding domain protein [Burkholderia cepacia]